MASTTARPTKFDPHSTAHASAPLEDRPLPLRTYSESGPSTVTDVQEDEAIHYRRKSTHPHLYLTPSATFAQPSNRPASLATVSEAREAALLPRQYRSGSGRLVTPPVTPEKAGDGLTDPNMPHSEQYSDILSYDFSKIDYELDRARVIGKGLWSTVYYAQPIVKSPSLPRKDIPSPPVTPQRSAEFPACSLYAVKVASRPDAKEVFRQESRILTKIQRSPDAFDFIVRFMGYDDRMSSLVFEGVLGGSLDSLSRRLKVMTELERHLELRTLFPKIADDLIAGLEFIHDANVVHADIKPANVLLDITDQDQRSLKIRARYIDFSAAFTPGEDDAANAGGTWDYMAPEQLRIQKDLNTPTFASDIWALGITLTSIIVGGSPYAAACGDNVFMLREAIKSGDVLGFARMDPVVQKRMAACQDFVDCCRLALHKDKTRRVAAAAWKKWIEMELLN